MLRTYIVLHGDLAGLSIVPMQRGVHAAAEELVHIFDGEEPVR